MQANKTVYIVDDDTDDRMLIREALENEIKDIEIIEIHDGQLLLEALPQDQADQPALILMDMNMPRVSGLEALEQIKSNPFYRHIPVMMVSTTSNQDLIKHCYNQGANAFIIKPVNYSGYLQIAQAVNVCFLNNYRGIDEQVISKNFRNKSILVVEDNNDHWEMIEMALKRALPDIALIHKSDQSSTLDFLANEYASVKPPIEMILLDLYLPARHDGLGLLADIRNFMTTQNLPAVPVIVLSYSNHPKDRTASYAGQASAYLLKSADPAKSFSKLRDVCSFWWDTIALPQPLHKGL
ncbi:response regulator [Dyadobacter arcticus]|uniref:CheY-like chemotaxis protein n=1 Tax=Dyadobacter arcticus TaxID=1078754 RepID=A0ABX0ULH1_9BACT|nr:response regulator [Dyadobacter arcticus]NIJ52525.1 CheY-like chemotaxis protein [Dyadobacter arcticus]